ncbi:phage tail assembly protein T [Enterobacter sp. Ap-916]|nr:phage tail assembly protein T [Enterobacter sp. Ap-867]NIG29615.1 phage tail assembly protein T [Enterobacter sp. Ap-916]NWC65153.1 phage tail assembly protein T [Cedecea sp. P7760]
MHRLAREFRRADWRRMLSEMSASEFAGWVSHFAVTPFSDELLDAEFATTKGLIVAMLTGNSDISDADFSLLTGEAVEPEQEKTDEDLMLAGEGVYGGVRYGPAN